MKKRGNKREKKRETRAGSTIIDVFLGVCHPGLQ